MTAIIYVYLACVVGMRNSQVLGAGPVPPGPVVCLPLVLILSTPGGMVERLPGYGVQKSGFTVDCSLPYKTSALLCYDAVDVVTSASAFTVLIT